MIRRALVAALLATVACKKPAKTEPEATPHEVKETPRAGLGELVLPTAVPTVASAVIVVRGRDGLLAALAELDPIAGDDALAPMVDEIDEYLAGRYGVRMATATRVTGFVLPGVPVKLGVLVEGLPEVAPPGEEVGRVGEVALHRIEGEEAVEARLGDALAIGHRGAIEAAAKAFADGPGSSTALGTMLSSYAGDAVLAVALKVDVLPAEVRAQLGETPVDRLLVALGPTELVLVGEGSADALSELSGQIDRLLGAAAATTTARKEAALEADDPAEVVAAIALDRVRRRLDRGVQRKVEEERFVARVALDPRALERLAPLAILALATSVPALTKRLRAPRAEEARRQLAVIFDRAATYFDDPRILVEVLPDGTTVSSRVHLCPNDGRMFGNAGLTPPLRTDCNEGPDGLCVPGEGDSPGHYQAARWTDNDVWTKLDYALTDPHAFHYDFKYENTDDGFGHCRFTAQAFGDLDGDGVFSTYARIGVASEQGVRPEAGLYIDRALE